jgi:Ca-activated chloride channel family protein
MREPASDSGPKSKLDVAKEELKHAIDALSDGDTFTVIAFAGSVEKWQPKMTKVTAAVKERARKWIDNDLNLDLGTNIHAGMRAAFEIAGLGSKDVGYTSEIDTIFFMTDGQPTVGEVQDPLELRRLIREWNRLSRIRIHCIGVGKDLNIPLLYGIAEDAGGQFQHR